MFSKKAHFSSRLKFNKSSFNGIVAALNKAGFRDVTVEIPREYKKFPKHVFSAAEFLDLNYNFTSQILTAKSESDVVKILFVNNSNTGTVFNDTTFPSSNSERSKFFVETQDPVRLLGLEYFVHNLLKDSSIRSPFVSRFQNIILMLSSLVLFSYPIFFMGMNNEQPGKLGTFFQNNVLIFSFLFIISIFYLLFYNLYPGGLYVNKFEHPFVAFSKRILVGDFKDNAFISFLLSVLRLLLAGFAVNILWYFLGDVIVDAIKFLGSLIK